MAAPGRVLVLHGKTGNGKMMDEYGMSSLKRELLADGYELVFMTAPHKMSRHDVIGQFTKLWGADRKLWVIDPTTSDNYEWFPNNAGEQDLQNAKNMFLALPDGPPIVGVIGLSQGAVMAALVACWVELGELPAPKWQLHWTHHSAPFINTHKSLEDYFARAPRLTNPAYIYGEEKDPMYRTADCATTTQRFRDMFPSEKTVVRVTVGRAHALPRARNEVNSFMEWVRKV